MRVATSVTLAAALVLGGVLVPADPAAPSSPTWSVVPSPNRPTPAGGTVGAGLNGVACATSTSCVAVGAYRGGDLSLPGLLAGHLRAGTWSIAAAPQPPAVKHPTGELASVACAAPNRCFGVGYFHNGRSTRALVERWDGNAWSVVPNPKMPGTTRSSLSGVACPTTTSCFAVGYVLRSGAAAKTLIEHWNGKSWSVVASPIPPGGGRLSGVACATHASCVAVGATSATRPKTLIARWDGTTWKVVKSPSPTDSTNSELTGASCPSDRACFAVGRYYSGHDETSSALAERSVGDTWSLVATPDKPQHNSGYGTALSGITCLSATACFAVGSKIVNDTAAPRVVRWNGTSWSVVPVGDPNQFTQESLASISCVSMTSCIAVGTSRYGTWIGRWNGTRWSENRTGGSASRLADIACPSTTTCFAVGASAPGFRYFVDNAALIERWDGTSWKISPSPTVTPPEGWADLSSVSCPTTTACFAVGRAGGSTDTHVLIERWDGAQWTHVNAPDPPGLRATQLLDVSCPSPTSCFAVGFGGDYPNYMPFVERWDGNTWSLVPLPSAADGSVPDLRGITCASASECIAVGARQGTPSDPMVTTVERWDGTTWTILPSPNDPDVPDNWLTSVTCPAADRCIAVGSRFNPDGPTYTSTLIEEWDGTAWSIVPSANRPDAYSSELTGVACKTTADCFAVGRSFGAQVSAMTLHWDGATWTLVPDATPAGAETSELSDVFCGNNAYTAVGDIETATARQTLVERSS